MKNSRETRFDRFVSVMIHLLVSMVFILVLYPLIYVVSCSFSDPALVNIGKVWLLPKGVTLAGYERIFRDSEILIGYRNTIFYTVAGTSVNLLVTLPAAYALSKKTLKGRKALMMVFIFTMYFSGGLIPTYLLVKELGLLNTWAVMIILGAVSVYNLIIARTFFESSIPASIEESARIDGCNWTQTFLWIVLPVSKAIIVVLTLYYAIGHWNGYFNAMIYLSDRSKTTLQLVLREILLTEFSRAEMMGGGEMMSDMDSGAKVNMAALVRYGLIVVASVPVMVVYPFLQKYFYKGVMLGSIKG